MLARNSSSSVGMGVASGGEGGESDSGSRASESASTRVKEESNDSVDLRDCLTISMLETEQSNVDPPKVSEDSIGLVTISPLVMFRVL
jgi:hypothetical protein